MNFKKQFDFVKNRNKFFAASVILCLIGLVALLISGLNLGVDFKAGTSIDISLGQAVTKEKANQIFTAAIEREPSVLTIGGDNQDRVSARFDEVLSDDNVRKVQDAFKTEFGENVSQEVNTVSPDIARELALKALYGVLIASVAVSIYVSIRFEWRFATAVVITTLYDAFVVIGLFAIFQLEVDLPFVAAILTTIGYSINDKIVIFDRIRENQRFTKVKTDEDLSTMINNSIWQTMSRNINTVVTILIAAICLFIFGSESIKLFALAKIIGLASGAYSSICIASPLWFLLKSRSNKKKVKAAA
ncbi:protein translocase subunit SecF [Paenibacillus eucommiae]|uniref:Protein-export membrane protein SecF n=1 Tax=Paenibacillus eucommiae TaxID=1355755 RepID=A0ABS4JA88_9BACL|nr:protein translocase subunit SecF [Paenibacillus eucommiae]MBP1996759.1 SecD/SecF fusion protein [Paenibacillus eucommiae]